MYARHAITVLILTASSLAQQAPCPSDKPVDEIIAEIHKQQSKKNNRNKNPIPDNICIFGWCPIPVKKTPPTIPSGQNKTEVPADTATPPQDPTSSSSSSSKTAVDKCNEKMDRVLDAAHNVEVGDFYYNEKNYRAALMRYKDAAEAKPDDNAIAVRLGRVSEKLNDPTAAIDHYTAAAKLAGPDKWTQEARTALAHLQHAAPASK